MSQGQSQSVPRLTSLKGDRGKGLTGLVMSLICLFAAVGSSPYQDATLMFSLFSIAFFVSTAKRDWLRFSLRSLFVVVTVFSVWLGSQMQFVHRREAMVQLLAGRGVVALRDPCRPLPTIPLIRL